MGRKIAREAAMKLLYQLELQKDDKEEQISYVMDNEELTKKDKVYINSVVNGVLNNFKELDYLISNSSKGWKIDRIPRIDLAIMRISLFEIMHRNDIPVNISINEAVELAKKFSSDEAPSFINGVIGEICKKNGLPKEDENK